MTLARAKGSPIASRTLDLGAGGMRVATDRPLAVDEMLSFDLPLDPQSRVEGQARVLREQPFRTYALRFERLSSQDAETLSRLVIAATA